MSVSISMVRVPISFNFIARVQTLLLLGLPSCSLGWILAIVRRIKGYISYEIKLKNFIIIIIFINKNSFYSPTQGENMH